MDILLNCLHFEFMDRCICRYDNHHDKLCYRLVTVLNNSNFFPFHSCSTGWYRGCFEKDILFGSQFISPHSVK